MVELIIGIASSVAVAFLGWLWIGGRGAMDRRAVYRWLRERTRDAPGESHIAAVAIAKGTQLPEHRARAACITDARVLRFGADASEVWSVWREQPQSVYETRGVLTLGGDAHAERVTAAEWRDMEARFERIPGEIDGSRSTYRESGNVTWGIHPRSRSTWRRHFPNGALWADDDGVRHRQRFEAEARVAGRLKRDAIF